MRRKILIVVVGLFVFLVVFLVSIFLTFPTDSIRHFAEKQIEKALKQEQSVEIEDLSISPLLNVTATNFKMTPLSAATDEAPLSTGGGTFLDIFYCAPYVEEQAVVIDEVFVNPSIFKSLKGKPAGKFQLKMQDGVIEGELKSSSEVMEIEAEGSDISLNEFALVSNMTKMQIYGLVEFTLKTILQKGKLKGLNLEMTSSNTALCPKRIKLDVAGLPYIDIPFTVFGMIKAKFELKEDLLIIHELKSTGPDIQLDVSGDVSMKKSKGGQDLNIEATILPSQEWLEANNMKVLYQVCEKHDDGSVHLSLRGTTKKIRHDCGTPIPEPVEVKETPEPEKKAEPVKKAEPEKAEKKPAKSDPEPEKKPATKPSNSNQPDPDSVMRPLRTLDGGEIDPSRSNRNRNRERPSGAGRSRSERLDRGDPSGGEVLRRNMDNLNENIDREMRRRGEGRSEFQRRRGVDREE